MQNDEGSVLPVKLIQIRMYKNAKDWWHFEEVTVPRAPDGSLNIAELESQLILPGKIRVCKP